MAIIKDKYSGESRGFGFVEMPNSTEAGQAIESLKAPIRAGESHSKMRPNREPTTAGCRFLRRTPPGLSRSSSGGERTHGFKLGFFSGGRPGTHIEPVGLPPGLFLTKNVGIRCPPRGESKALKVKRGMREHENSLKGIEMRCQEIFEVTL